MKVRGVPSYNDAEAQLPEIPAISRKLRLILKVAELYLGTCRPLVVRSHCAEKALEASSPRKPVVALWHSSLVYMLYHCRQYKGAVMTSPSKDGEWVASAVSYWGSVPVRGSRLKGGLYAIRKMAGYMRDLGFASGVVADGSRGPVNVAQIGAVVLARDSGCPIVPMGFAASRAVYFNSWDRLVLPLPFSRVCVVYGEMFTVPSDTRGVRVEFFRKKLENGLNAATAEARRRMGLDGNEREVGDPPGTGTETDT